MRLHISAASSTASQPHLSSPPGGTSPSPLSRPPAHTRVTPQPTSRPGDLPSPIMQIRWLVEEEQHPCPPPRAPSFPAT